MARLVTEFRVIFHVAMSLAYNMVWRLGMADSSYIGDYTVIPENMLSESTKLKLSEEVEKILKGCLKDVEDLLKKEWYLLEEFANELLQKEELDYDEIEAIFAKHGKSNSVIKGIPEI